MNDERTPEDQLEQLLEERQRLVAAGNTDAANELDAEIADVVDAMPRRLVALRHQRTDLFGGDNDVDAEALAAVDAKIKAVSVHVPAKTYPQKVGALEAHMSLLIAGCRHGYLPSKSDLDSAELALYTPIDTEVL